MNHKPLLRLIIVTQTFLLFAILCLPLVVRSLQQPLGKLAYIVLAAVCVILAFFLRRQLAELDR